MYSKSIYPLELSKEALDEYLIKGWFRMGQSLFTTNFLIFNGQLYSVAWLRVGLSRFKEDKKLAKLKKLNKNFRVEIKPANLTTSHELLFEDYKKHVDFEASDSLHHLLFHYKTYNIFDTYQVDLYDNDLLIACGIFDIGQKTAQGITSFYNHNYKKNSLGKYLICLKMEYCANIGLDYFYPGYFVPGYEPFDYKLELGRDSLEFFLFRSGTWEPIEYFNIRETTIQTIWSKLTRAQEVLARANCTVALMYYPYFSFNLIEEMYQNNLVDIPMFLKISNLNHPVDQILVYQLASQTFQLVTYKAILNFDHIEPVIHNFNKEVIVIDKILLGSTELQQIVDYLTNQQKNSIVEQL